ncbi:hypothetical protein BRD05_07815 [Halobacteriales archaeon QS_9_70_65]|nr:MAG: hypothetical protein BRD05_07815 [Halobacteriales archaeon QS_9_70_65]
MSPRRTKTRHGCPPDLTSDDESDAAPPDRTRLLERTPDRCVSLDDERRIRAFDDGDEASAAIAEGVPSEADLRAGYRESVSSARSTARSLPVRGWSCRGPATS